MEFDPPPPDLVVAILVGKAQTDPHLAAQIEAAQWEAIATVMKLNDNEAPYVDSSDSDTD